MRGPDWAAAARAALDAGPAAMVTVLATEGSVPREAGTRMIVTADATTGTIGGGALEHRAIQQARALLDHAPGAWRVQEYPLGPLLGQCCGGRVRILVERLDPAASDWLSEIADGVNLCTHFGTAIMRAIVSDAPRGIAARGDAPGPGASVVERIGGARLKLLMFGAGHVGRAIAGAVAPLPIALAWFDTRSEAAALPGVALVAEEEAADCAREAPAGAAVLILTHDHAVDYRLTAAALGSGAGFVGLIGSGTKRARFLAKLAREGIGAAERLTCPIGLPGIAGKDPHVIAASVAAQLLTLTAA